MEMSRRAMISAILTGSTIGVASLVVESKPKGNVKVYVDYEATRQIEPGEPLINEAGERIGAASMRYYPGHVVMHTWSGIDDGTMNKGGYTP